MIKTATSIDEVISILQEIIDQETRNNSPLAYFPALYRLVTLRVKAGIEKNEFEDIGRMEQLDMLFANRYITAYLAFRGMKSHSGCWRIAFEAEKKPLTILQHLLLGMNAHINLDLGIAAADTMQGKSLAGLHNDFNTINLLLSEMSDKVRLRIGKVSPLLGLLDSWSGDSDALIIQFSINKARDGAWKSAQEFHGSANRSIIQTARDRKIAALGLGLIYPNSRWIRTLVATIRLAETRNTKKVVHTITG